MFITFGNKLLDDARYYTCSGRWWVWTKKLSGILFELQKRMKITHFLPKKHIFLSLNLSNMMVIWLRSKPTGWIVFALTDWTIDIQTIKHFDQTKTELDMSQNYHVFKITLIWTFHYGTFTPVKRNNSADLMGTSLSDHTSKEIFDPHRVKVENRIKEAVVKWSHYSLRC